MSKVQFIRTAVATCIAVEYDNASSLIMEVESGGTIASAINPGVVGSRDRPDEVTFALAAEIAIIKRGERNAKRGGLTDAAEPDRFLAT
jgi:hypothetical protein